MKLTQLKVYVICNGIKNRCRKSERHMINVGYFELNADRELILSQARNKAVSEMRTINPGAYACLDYVEIENDSGMRIETWMPFDKRHVRLPLAEMAVTNA